MELEVGCHPELVASCLAQYTLQTRYYIVFYVCHKMERFRKLLWYNPCSLSSLGFASSLKVKLLDL